MKLAWIEKGSGRTRFPWDLCNEVGIILKDIQIKKMLLDVGAVPTEFSRQSEHGLRPHQWRSNPDREQKIRESARGWAPTRKISDDERSPSRDVHKSEGSGREHSGRPGSRRRRYSRGPSRSSGSTSAMPRGRSSSRGRRRHKQSLLFALDGSGRSSLVCIN